MDVDLNLVFLELVFFKGEFLEEYTDKFRKMENGELYVGELYQMYRSPDKITEIKVSRLRWGGLPKNGEE